jgi:hypothetical protein
VLATRTIASDRGFGPLKRSLAGLLVAALLCPSIVFAQAARAGVVTVLEGNVTARRVGLPAVVPLTFKDDVFQQDTVTTGDKALARMLLGGKAVVTVRERSVLTITEVPGRSTLELASGKFSLAVAREKMTPGEEIQIRTPNAVAGVRGTVVVTEVERQSAQIGGGGFAAVTTFYVIRGAIEVQQLDSTGQPAGTSQSVTTLQSYALAGTSGAPRLLAFSPERIFQILSGLLPTGRKRGFNEELLKAQAKETAANLIAALTADTRAVASPPPRFNPAILHDIRPETFIIIANACGQRELPQCDKIFQLSEQRRAVGRLLDGRIGNLTLTNQPARTFTGNFTSTQLTALLEAIGITFIQVGAGVPVILVSPGANVSLAGPLLSIIDSNLRSGGSLLDMFGALASTSSLALIALDPSFALTLGNIVNVSGNGAQLNLAGPLVTDIGGTLSTGTGDLLVKAFVAIQDGGAVTGTSTSPFVSLTGTKLTSEGGFLNIIGGSSLSLTGPLLQATGGSMAALDLVGLVGSSLTSKTTDALIQLTGTQVTLDDTRNGLSGRLFEMVSTGANDATVLLRGPLLATSNAAITTSSDVLGVFNGARFIGESPSPLLGLTGGSVSASGSLAFVTGASGGTSSTLLLAGALLSAINTTITLGGNVIQLGASGTVLGATAAPLLQLDQSALTVGGSLISVDDTGTRLLLGGPILAAVNQSRVTSNALPLLSATLGGVISIANQPDPIVSFTGGSSLTAGALLFAGLNDGAFTTNGSTGALFSLKGGSHTLSTGSLPAILVRGSSLNTNVSVSVDDGDGGFIVRLMDLATDQPLKHGGTLVDAENATLSVANGVSFDKALFNASAPLLNLRTSVATVAGDAISLINNARVTAGLSLVKLDASVLNVAGSLVNMRSGSLLTVTGDLLRLANGSTLNITGGSLLTVAGNSVVKIGGALVNFTGTPSTINISNNLCALGCSLLGGIPVVGAANITSVGPGVTGVGTINVTPGSAAVVVLSGSVVTIGGAVPIP